MEQKKQVSGIRTIRIEITPRNAHEKIWLATINWHRCRLPGEPCVQHELYASALTYGQQPGHFRC